LVLLELEAGAVPVAVPVPEREPVAVPELEAEEEGALKVAVSTDEVGSALTVAVPCSTVM
jgi:hypothetical protein